MSELRCQQCDGPIVLSGDGPQAVVTVTHTVMLDADDARVVGERSTGWCSDCLREWDVRMGLDGYGRS